MIRHFAAAFLVLTALTGCKGTTTPPPSPTHVYVLRPPAVLETATVRIEILSETLAFYSLSLIHISEPTRRTPISYAVFCL